MEDEKNHSPPSSPPGSRPTSREPSEEDEHFTPDTSLEHAMSDLHLSQELPRTSKPSDNVPAREQATNYEVYDYRGSRVKMNYHDRPLHEFDLAGLWNFTAEFNNHLTGAGHESGQWFFAKFSSEKMWASPYSTTEPPSSPSGSVLMLNVPNGEDHIATISLLYARFSPLQDPLVIHLHFSPISTCSSPPSPGPSPPIAPSLSAEPSPNPPNPLPSASTSSFTALSSPTHAAAASPTTPQPSAPRKSSDPRLGPPEAGDSIGPKGGDGSGTLGAIVVEKGPPGAEDEGEFYALSCYHVVSEAEGGIVYRPSVPDLEKSFIPSFSIRHRKAKTLQRHVQQIRTAASSFGTVYYS